MVNIIKEIEMLVNINAIGHFLDKEGYTTILSYGSKKSIGMVNVAVIRRDGWVYDDICKKAEEILQELVTK